MTIPEPALPAGPMAMVKIDGAKIKTIRERQGLTQLYLATAVQVTTDTISRWENRRYPTIKKDNALKLAETLGVHLGDILLEDGIPDDSSDFHEHSHSPHAPHPVKEPGPKKLPLNPLGLKRAWPIILLSATLLTIIGAFAWYGLQLIADHTLQAKRVMPDHCVARQPFPVIIKVTGKFENAAALIVKENLPPDATIIATLPQASSKDKDSPTQLKWIQKIESSATFAYLISVNGKIGDTVTFSGSATISQELHPPPSIGGGETVTIGIHHWADTNRDNRISDKELLAAYDQFGDLQEAKLDFGQLEKIWLGSGYQWNARKNTFEVLE